MWSVPRLFITNLSASAASGIKHKMLAITLFELLVQRFLEEINRTEGGGRAHGRLEPILRFLVSRQCGTSRMKKILEVKIR